MSSRLPPSPLTPLGKTFAFLLPVIATLHGSEDPVRALIDDRGVLVRALVLAPTRELASQINLEAKKLCFDSSLRSTVVYGGADIRSQLSELASGTDVLVATPGRLLDLIDRGVVCLHEVEFLVLDEADRMLNMGFEPQIREIVQHRGMPGKERRHTFMFSATFASEIQILAKEFLREYVWVTVGRVGSTVENITQRLVLASADKTLKLQLLIEAIGSTSGRTLVFVQMKRMAAYVCAILNNSCGVSAEEIHGDRSQAQREAALRAFRSGAARVLVATDVAARGLDIPSVMHVIQFDLPASPEEFDTYVHRIGRTGRAGSKGLATSFYVPGRESEGNARIAPMILRLLQENQQDIPDWFLALEDIHDMSASVSNRRQYQQKSQGVNFGSRDVRGGPRYQTHQLPRFNAPVVGYGDRGQQGNYYPQAAGQGTFYPQYAYAPQYNYFQAQQAYPNIADASEYYYEREEETKVPAAGVGFDQRYMNNRLARAYGVGAPIDYYAESPYGRTETARQAYMQYAPQHAAYLRSAGEVYGQQSPNHYGYGQQPPSQQKRSEPTEGEQDS